MGSRGLLLKYFIFIHIFSYLFDFTTQNICTSRGRVCGCVCVGGGGGGGGRGRVGVLERT